jgi:hypothetical protein
VPKNYALRRTRRGKGLLPPNPNWWEHEHNGLDLRQELGSPLADALSHEAAFCALPDVHVLPHGELGPEAAVEHFRNAGSRNWSGMCIPCDGVMLVVYNDSHPPRRIRATLMEEFFHLWLGHRPTRLKVFADGDSKRDFERAKESEAYGSGAAALVPYNSLRAMLEAGNAVQAIADHFVVSEQLVQFRIRICKLASAQKRSKH